MKNSNAKASKSYLGQKWDNDNEWMLSTHKSESDVTYSQVWWPILRIHALFLPIQVHTHSSEHTHTRSSGQLWCPGSSLGFGALLKGTSSWYWRWRECCTFNPTIPARLRLELATFQLWVRLSTIRPWQSTFTSNALNPSLNPFRSTSTYIGTYT